MSDESSYFVPTYQPKIVYAKTTIEDMIGFAQELWEEPRWREIHERLGWHGDFEGNDDAEIRAYFKEITDRHGMRPSDLLWLLSGLSRLLAAGEIASFEGELDLDPERLVFIDDTWVKANMARTHGRAP